MDSLLVGSGLGSLEVVSIGKFIASSNLTLNTVLPVFGFIFCSDWRGNSVNMYASTWICTKTSEVEPSRDSSTSSMALKRTISSTSSCISDDLEI